MFTLHNVNRLFLTSTRNPYIELKVVDVSVQLASGGLRTIRTLTKSTEGDDLPQFLCRSSSLRNSRMLENTMVNKGSSYKGKIIKTFQAQIFPEFVHRAHTPSTGLLDTHDFNNSQDRGSSAATESASRVLRCSLQDVSQIIIREPSVRPTLQAGQTDKSVQVFTT